MFFRQHSDGTRVPLDLRHHLAGPRRTSCWIIGGGPSLKDLPYEQIARSPAPKLAINLCGTGLLRPTIWTAYDPTHRFHASVYRDASILKLLPARRATDVLPDSTDKVGDCPNTLFFEREEGRGFHNFPPFQSGADSGLVVDWQDSFVQGLELAWWLGFRRLFLAGTDLSVRPPASHCERAAEIGVTWQPGELLRDFYDRCMAAGLSPDELTSADPIRPYHFEETKTLSAAFQTDGHYFRIVQALRLSRRAMGLAGLELVSVTPGSRLNAFFPVMSVEEALAEIEREVGQPASETTLGKYRVLTPRAPEGPVLMKDVRPSLKTTASTKPNLRPETQPDDRESRAARCRAAVNRMPEEEIELDDES